MTCARLLLLTVLGANLLAPARAQDATPVKSVPFSFTNAATTSAVKQDRFCLPRGEQLVKVLQARTVSSNAASHVDVNGDTAANCIVVSATLPAARSLCVTVPAPTWSEPGKTKQVCNNVATVLSIVVDYQTRASS